MRFLSANLENGSRGHASVEDLETLPDGRSVDPVLRIAEFDGVFRHHAGDLVEIGSHLGEHLPLRGGPHLFIRLALAEIPGEGLLANDVFARFERVQDQGKVEGVGDAKIDDVNGRIIEEEAIVGIHLGDAVAAGQLLGAGLALARNRDDLHGDLFHLMIGSKVKRGRKSGSHDSHSHWRMNG